MVMRVDTICDSFIASNATVVGMNAMDRIIKTYSSIVYPSIG